MTTSEDTTALASQWAATIAERFGLSPTEHAIRLEPTGSGHINKTYLLYADDRPYCIIQRINTTIFPQYEKMIRNAQLIEMHLRDKKAKGLYDLQILRHFPTVKGTYAMVSETDGHAWRALENISDAYSVDTVSTAAEAETAANAFGMFAAALADFNSEQLYPVIPDFHNLAMRVEKYKLSIKMDTQDRVSICQQEVEFVNRHANALVEELQELMKDLPLRACHNDTKINNMMFDSLLMNEPSSSQSATAGASDSEGKMMGYRAKAVIDLDTCMHGYLLFDFGDMVRTFCSPEEEDSTNLANVVVREDVFAAIVKGYITPLRSSISRKELESFLLGAKVMPFMIGLRFLTDFVDGDVYFPTKYDLHNLDRARNQFALFADVVKKAPTLSQIVHQHV